MKTCTECGLYKPVSDTPGLCYDCEVKLGFPCPRDREEPTDIGLIREGYGTYQSEKEIDDEHFEESNTITEEAYDHIRNNSGEESLLMDGEFDDIDFDDDPYGPYDLPEEWRD